MNNRGRLIVFGILSRSPYAGIAWQVLHYLEGFRRLGFDTLYADDTGDWPTDRSGRTANPGPALEFIKRISAWWGYPDRWVYRSGVDGSVIGLHGQSFEQWVRSADIIVNLTGSTPLREEHLAVPIRIYLESDPFVPQVAIAQGDPRMLDILQRHTHHFTFGENIGTPFCDLPVGRFTFRPTRQPIIMEWWSQPPESVESRARWYSTIANWNQSKKDIEWMGERYSWSKHQEFEKFLDIPGRSGKRFELLLAKADVIARRTLREHGWTVLDAARHTTLRLLPYRSFILKSRGEFTVAKDQNIRGNTGWFSDRSASYLAAGRPVITQDTGFNHVLPTGKGLFDFRTMDDILAALDAIEDDYDGNRRAAQDVADQYFRSDKVLSSLLARL